MAVIDFAGKRLQTPGDITDAHRAQWSGNLDDEELARPGGLLLAALFGAANERGHNPDDLSRELGIAYGYVNQLRCGIRAVNHTSDDFALACAKYLSVPRLTVLMLAGRIAPSDWFENRETMASELTQAMVFMCKDPNWGPLITHEMRRMSPDSLYALVRLYESATKKKLLTSHVEIEELAEQVEECTRIQAERQRAVDEYIRRKTEAE